MNGGNNGDGNLLFVQGSDVTAATTPDGRKTTTSTVRRRRVPVELVTQEVDVGDVVAMNQNKNRYRELDASDLELDFDFRFLASSSMSMDIVMRQVFYVATTTPLGENEVESSTTLFIPQWTGLSEMATPNDVVCFTGSATQLEADIESVYGGGDNATQCSAANGCGVHVHTGTSCEDTETQGGHWYNTETLSEDPWAIIGYLSTNSDGYGQYASCVRTGYDVMSDPSLLEGHVFIVHGEDGSRVSCGPIVQGDASSKPSAVKFYSTDTVPIPGNGATGTGAVNVMSGLSEGVTDGVCYMGWATGLEPDVVSFLVNGSTSDQCDVKNGCGAHIHEGPGCESKDAQGSHYYDREEIASDPWALESYYRTDNAGTAALIGCVITGDGASEYQSRAFIVHSTDGDRLLCGLLE